VVSRLPLFRQSPAEVPCVFILQLSSAQLGRDRSEQPPVIGMAPLPRHALAVGGAAVLVPLAS